MPLTICRCTQCGCELEVESSEKSMLCTACGSRFLIEEAISHYHTHVEHLHADKVVIDDGSGADSLARSGDTYIQFKEFQKAEQVFKKMCDKFPHDSRGWYGLARSICQDFSPTTVPNVSRFRNVEDCLRRLNVLRQNDAQAGKMADRLVQAVDCCRKNSAIYRQEQLEKLEVEKAATNSAVAAIKAKGDAIVGELKAKKRSAKVRCIVAEIITYIVLLALAAFSLIALPEIVDNAVSDALGSSQSLILSIICTLWIGAKLTYILIVFLLVVLFVICRKIISAIKAKTVDRLGDEIKAAEEAVKRSVVEANAELAVKIINTEKQLENFYYQ